MTSDCASASVAAPAPAAAQFQVAHVPAMEPLMAAWPPTPGSAAAPVSSLLARQRRCHPAQQRDLALRPLLLHASLLASLGGKSEMHVCWVPLVAS